MFQSFKGRTINEGQQVKVYYNLHLNMFSIKDKASQLVLGHAEVVTLDNVTFTVSEVGRQRVIKEQVKNVHAYVIGTYTGTTQGKEKRPAYYNPYQTATFQTEERQPLKKADSVTCINKKILY